MGVLEEDWGLLPKNVFRLTMMRKHMRKEWQAFMKDLPRFVQPQVWPGILIHMFIVFLGCLVIATAVNFFIQPTRLADGGFTGIALIINYLYDIDVQYMVAWLNIPLVLIGIPMLGYRLIFSTVFGVGMLTFALAITEPLNSLSQAWRIYEDPWITVLVGGVLMGLGLGIVLRVGSNTGGSDLLALIVRHFTGIPLNCTLLLFDVSVLLCAWRAVGVERVMYTLPYMFIYTFVIKVVLENFGPARTVTVISPQVCLIVQKIHNSGLHMGATILKGRCSYTDQQRSIIYMVVPASELGALRGFIERIDPSAFIVVHRCWECMRGFRKKVTAYIGDHQKIS